MAATQTMLAGTAPKDKPKFRYLFFAQLTLLILFPYLEKAGLPAVIFRIFGAIAFFTAVYAVSERRAQWITALTLAVPAGVMNGIYALRPQSGIEVPTLAITLLFLCFTLVSLLRAVLRAPRVTSDTLYGAISVYLLMSIVWGVAYLLIETLQPGSISVDTARHPSHKLDWFDCVFYSFVTLTSTGYGDMVPVTAPMRSLSILEAVSGVMYMAVLVARLVGLYAAGKSELRP